MTEENNPYAAPQARVVATAPQAGEADVVLLPQPLARRAGEGTAWVGDGWRLFRRRPGFFIALWVLYFVIYLAVAIPLSFVGGLGGVATALLGMLLAGGMVLGLHGVYAGQSPGLGVLFSVFSHPALSRLLGISVVYAVGALLLGLLAATLTDALPFWKASMGLGDATPEQMMADGSFGIGSMLLFSLVSFLLNIPLLMAIWFASANVLFSGQGVLEAMGASFRACLKNLLPLTVWSLVITGLMLATVFTLFLGMLVVLPLLMTSWYVSWRRICTQFPDEPVA